MSVVQSWTSRVETWVGNLRRDLVSDSLTALGSKGEVIIRLIKKRSLVQRLGEMSCKLSKNVAPL